MTTPRNKPHPRDRHADHVDTYVSGFEDGRFVATFEHCGRAMIEVPIGLLITLPPQKPAQGITARLECPGCKAALRLEIMPENGSADAEKA